MPEKIIVPYRLAEDDTVSYEIAEYKEYAPVWNKCRTIYKGGDSVKNERERFLPKLTDMEFDEYDNYLKRALFYNATKRTVDGLVGALFQKDPHLSYPTKNDDDLHKRQEEIDDFFDNLSLQKVPFTLLLKDICREVIIVGRVGILVDAQMESAERDEKIYLTQYTAESIINWHTEIIDSCPTLTLVVLKEVVKELKGKYKPKYKIQYRVLVLNKNMDSDNKYVYENYVYAEVTKDGKTEYEEKAHNTPTMKGMTFDKIPFYFVNAESTTAEIHPSPINDLVNINISHYMSSADLEHGRHFTGLPTAWIAGIDAQDAKNKSFYIGSGKAWIAGDPRAKAGFLEFTGQGLSALENALKEKQDQMAVLGARLLEMPKAAVEASDTQKTRKSSENSVLASITDNVSLIMTRVCMQIAEWRGVIEHNKIEVAIQKDYTVAEADPQLLAQLLQMIGNGTLSYDSFFFNLVNMQLVPAGRTADDEMSLIENAGVGDLNPVKDSEMESDDDGMDDKDTDKDNDAVKKANGAKL